MSVSMAGRHPARWRVAVTRDEATDGPLSTALRHEGFGPVACPVVEQRPPLDVAPLAAAAAELEKFDWVICSSARAVTALMSLRVAGWPQGLRTAAVGARTAARLAAAGADPPPLVAGEAGADALWAALQECDSWRGRRVLVPAVAGGRRGVIDGLRTAGAEVLVVEAYRMVPLSPARIAARWRAIAADAVVLASPAASLALVRAVGPGALASLQAVVAIGPTTASTLAQLGVDASVSPAAGFTDVAHHLAALRAASHQA